MTDPDREPTIYQVLGEAGIARLLRYFRRPHGRESRGGVCSLDAPIRFVRSRVKISLFLVGWFGGPQEYIQRFGHPRLRARHLPFSDRHSGTGSVDAVHGCCLSRGDFHETLREQIRGAFAGMADHMRNRPDSLDPC